MARTSIHQTVRKVRELIGFERDALTLEITSELIRTPPHGTPRKTGYASANWMPALRNPGRAPSKRGKAEPTSGDVTRARAAQQSAIAAIVTNGGRDPEAEGHVTNHLPYIGPLADGWSKQNAAGWVESCVQQAVENRGQAASSSPLKGRPR